MNILRFLKNKILKSVTFMVILAELIIIWILYSIGFRLTYGPELGANWDAVGAIGQWFGVIVGLFIPIAAVYLQSQLDESKKDIGESNIALLEEFKSFKNEYEDKLKQLSSHFDNHGNFVIDGGKFEEHKKEKLSREDLKKEAYKFVNISMVTKTDRVAEHLNITADEAFVILEELLRHDGLISAGGIVRKDNIDTMVWTKKS